MTKSELAPGKMLLLGFQHVFAMFGATVLVPTLTGLSVSSTLLFAGLGTLLFHLITKRKVPAFLGSSFAFLGGYSAVKSLVVDSGTGANWIPYAGVGVACAGLLYVIVSQLFRLFGAGKVMRYFPPVVTGPIIICIGITLANSAVNNCANNWWIAMLAVLIVVVFNIWGKGMLKIIPILLGVVGSYLVAALCGQVDFTPVAEAAWIGLPFTWSDTVFSLAGNVDTSLLASAIAMMMPIALATMMEHIGDISAIGATCHRNFLANPGLHRTLIGDGVATSLAGLVGGPANTTYGENTGVLALSKVYDPFVIEIAALIAIILSFIPFFENIIGAMPAAVIGGASFILYGMISAIGVRNMVENHVDLTKQRNLMISAIILVSGLGINSIGGLQLGPYVNLSGLACAAIFGIVLNAALPGKDYEFSMEEMEESAAS